MTQLSDDPPTVMLPALTIIEADDAPVLSETQDTCTPAALPGMMALAAHRTQPTNHALEAHEYYELYCRLHPHTGEIDLLLKATRNALA